MPTPDALNLKAADDLARVCEAGRSLIEIVEGRKCWPWVAHGMRLVDSPEWCGFYVALKRAVGEPATQYGTTPAPKMDRREMMFANSGEEEADTPKRERHESEAELTGRDTRAERFAEMDARDQRPEGT